MNHFLDKTKAPLSVTDTKPMRRSGNGVHICVLLDSATHQYLLCIGDKVMEVSELGWGTLPSPKVTIEKYCTSYND